MEYMNNPLDKIYNHEFPNDMAFTAAFLQPKETEAPNFQEEAAKLMAATQDRFSKTTPPVLFGLGVMAAAGDHLNLISGKNSVAKLNIAAQISLIGFEAGADRVVQYNLVERVMQCLFANDIMTDSNEAREMIKKCLDYGITLNT